MKVFLGKKKDNRHICYPFFIYFETSLSSCINQSQFQFFQIFSAVLTRTLNLQFCYSLYDILDLKLHLTISHFE
uniref:Uncharacterized protein n=1 Tax=Clostridium argentinense TaxID=29341 RepID=A0A7I6N2S9_9CLOT|nr:hypothetical protein [Clostridium argentinense]